VILPRFSRSLLPAVGAALVAALLLTACGVDGPAPTRPAEARPADTRPAGPPTADPTPAAPERPVPAPPAAAGAMAPRLVSAPSGLLLSWLEPLSPEDNPTIALAHQAEPPSPGHRLRVSRFRDDAWSEPVTVAEGGDFFANWADFPSVVEGPGGVLLAHWLEKNGSGPYAYGVRIARSDDGGATWQPMGWLHTDRSATEHGFVSLAPLADGTFAAVWLDGREMPGGGPMTLRAARVGEEVTDSRLLDERVCDCCATAAVAISDGVLVAYRDRSEGEVRDVSVARYPAPPGEAPVTSVHDDGWVIAGCPVNGPAVASDGGDRVAVAWFTAAGGEPRVRLAVSGDAGRSFGEPAEIAAAGSLGRVGVALLGRPGGEPPATVVSWLGEDDDGDGAAVWLRRADRAGRLGAPWKLTATSAGRRSGFPQLVAHQGALYAAWVETRRDGEDEIPGRIHVRRVDPAMLPPAAG
jgi:hypothetical protein